MRILPDQQVGKKDPFISPLNLGIGIQADMHFIAHPVHIYMHVRRAFINKISFQVCDHRCENRKKADVKLLAISCKLLDRPKDPPFTCYLVPAVSIIQYPLSTINYQLSPISYIRAHNFQPHE